MTAGTIFSRALLLVVSGADVPPLRVTRMQTALAGYPVLILCMDGRIANSRVGPARRGLAAGLTSQFSFPTSVGNVIIAGWPGSGRLLGRRGRREEKRSPPPIRYSTVLVAGDRDMDNAVDFN
jgi:hypothetical protein